MEGNADSQFKDGHYLPRTLRTAQRDPVPNRASFPSDWKEKIESQAAPIWGLVTPSGLNFSLVSAAYQGAVRSAAVCEAMQWALEMHRTDGPWDDVPIQNPGGFPSKRRVGKGETNLLTRMLIICAEDIALANPYMIVYADGILRANTIYQTVAEAERAALQFTMALCHSMKSRVVDWACICRVPVPEAFDVNVYYQKLLECLINGNHILAMGYAEGFTSASLRDKEQKIKGNGTVDKEWFKQISQGVTVRGQSIKYFTNKRQVVWVAILKVVQAQFPDGNGGIKIYNNVREIVESCYGVSHDDRFRWEKSMRLFERYAVIACCLRDFTEARGLNFRAHPRLKEEYPGRTFWDMATIDQYRLFHRTQNLHYGISDVSKDKHSKVGKALNRDIQHFVEVKSFLRHDDPELMALSDGYLDYCFQTRYARQNHDGSFPIFDRSGLDGNQYRQWLPNLRIRNNLLNHIEDIVLTQTITVTYSECVENHKGMQMLGTKAAEGFSCDELRQIALNFQNNGLKAEWHDLPCPVAGAEPAGILILRNVLDYLITIPEANIKPEWKDLPASDRLLLELIELDWDKRAFMKGRVVNKKLRHNLCFADIDQEPNYEEGKGRVINFTHLPHLNSVREKLVHVFGNRARQTNGQPLLAEGNHYYDLDKCAISPHGDSERRIVIGMRLGGSMSLTYQWYQKTQTISPEMTFILNHSDVYCMSNKATGSDWMKKIIPTLRHSANCKNGVAPK